MPKTHSARHHWLFSTSLGAKLACLQSWLENICGIMTHWVRRRKPRPKLLNSLNLTVNKSRKMFHVQNYQNCPWTFPNTYRYIHPVSSDYPGSCHKIQGILDIPPSSPRGLKSFPGPDGIYKPCSKCWSNHRAFSQLGVPEDLQLEMPMRHPNQTPRWMLLKVRTRWRLSLCCIVSALKDITFLHSYIFNLWYVVSVLSINNVVSVFCIYFLDSVPAF